MCGCNRLVDFISDLDDVVDEEMVELVGTIIRGHSVRKMLLSC